MASTRNKNTQSDYDLRESAYSNQCNWLTYLNGPSSQAYRNNLPGNGLLAGRMIPNTLSRNSCDIESYLRGTGVTNLVTPYQPPVAEIYQLQSLNIMDKCPVILPDPLVIEPNQRPRPL